MAPPDLAVDVNGGAKDIEEPGAVLPREDENSQQITEGEKRGEEIEPNERNNYNNAGGTDQEPDIGPGELGQQLGNPEERSDTPPAGTSTRTNLELEPSKKDADQQDDATIMAEQERP